MRLLSLFSGSSSPDSEVKRRDELVGERLALKSERELKHKKGIRAVSVQFVRYAGASIRAQAVLLLLPLCLLFARVRTDAWSH